MRHICSVSLLLCVYTYINFNWHSWTIIIRNVTMCASPENVTRPNYTTTTTGGERLLRRNPGLPVVTWNAPLRVPCGNESGGGEDHKTTVKITPRLRELPISAPLRQSSGGNKPLRRRRSTGDSTRVPTRRREEDRKQEGLLPTIIRRHSYSHGRSSIEKGEHDKKF